MLISSLQAGRRKSPPGLLKIPLHSTMEDLLLEKLNERPSYSERALGLPSSPAHHSSQRSSNNWGVCESLFPLS